MDEKDRTLERCIKCGTTLSADNKRNCPRCNPQKTCIFCNGVLGKGACGGCGNSLSGNFLMGLDDFKETNDSPKYGLTGKTPEQTNNFSKNQDRKNRKKRRLSKKENYKPKNPETSINLPEELHNRRSIANKADIIKTYGAEFLIKFLTFYKKTNPPNTDKPKNVDNP